MNWTTQVTQVHVTFDLSSLSSCPDWVHRSMGRTSLSVWPTSCLFTTQHICNTNDLYRCARSHRNITGHVSCIDYSTWSFTLTVSSVISCEKWFWCQTSKTKLSWSWKVHHHLHLRLNIWPDVCWSALLQGTLCWGPFVFSFLVSQLVLRSGAAAPCWRHHTELNWTEDQRRGERNFSWVLISVVDSSFSRRLCSMLFVVCCLLLLLLW